MGFSVQYGPVIDTEFYNFTALNIPEDHPARGMQDTFWVDKDHLLRTHTSNIQARIMESGEPPIRIIAPGKAFRNEEITARSHVFFHQVDGFYIDKNVTFADLLGTMQTFLNKLFKEDVEVRYRPSYFPFVEPGLELDVACISCKGQGCQLCKHTGWLEILGAGMVHPEVLRGGGIDPEEYSGFAWGMGVERLVLLKYGINDIRTFVQNDMRFLNQF
jgi:phenylalanyl-tRNA synthetase alpha chain